MDAPSSSATRTRRDNWRSRRIPGWDRAQSSAEIRRYRAQESYGSVIVVIAATAPRILAPPALGGFDSENRGDQHDDEQNGTFASTSLYLIAMRASKISRIGMMPWPTATWLSLL